MIFQLAHTQRLPITRRTSAVLLNDNTGKQPREFPNKTLFLSKRKVAVHRWPTEQQLWICLVCVYSRNSRPEFLKIPAISPDLVIPCNSSRPFPKPAPSGIISV